MRHEFDSPLSGNKITLEVVDGSLQVTHESHDAKGDVETSGGVAVPAESTIPVLQALLAAAMVQGISKIGRVAAQVFGAPRGGAP